MQRFYYSFELYLQFSLLASCSAKKVFMFQCQITADDNLYLTKKSKEIWNASYIFFSLSLLCKQEYLTRLGYTQAKHLCVEWCPLFITFFTAYFFFLYLCTLLMMHRKLPTSFRVHKDIGETKPQRCYKGNRENVVSFISLPIFLDAFASTAYSFIYRLEFLTLK